MPAYLLALYGNPEDPDAFDAHYEAAHVPIGRTFPGPCGGGISAGPAIAPDGSIVFHKVAVLEFDSIDHAQRALASPEGQAAAADAANFVTGGVTVAMFELKDAGFANPKQDRPSGE
jgi:uncharacterized protein (TIGR02118 family)